MSQPIVQVLRNPDGSIAVQSNVTDPAGILGMLAQAQHKVSSKWEEALKQQAGIQVPPPDLANRLIGKNGTGG